MDLVQTRIACLCIRQSEKNSKFSKREQRFISQGIFYPLRGENWTWRVPEALLPASLLVSPLGLPVHALQLAGYSFQQATHISLLDIHPTTILLFLVSGTSCVRKGFQGPRDGEGWLNVLDFLLKMKCTWHVDRNICRRIHCATMSSFNVNSSLPMQDSTWFGKTLVSLDDMHVDHKSQEQEKCKNVFTFTTILNCI